MKFRPEKDFTDFFKALGERLEGKRKAAGYSSSEYFAHEAGVSRAQYVKYESGVTDLKLSNLLKIAEELEIPVDELLKGLHKPTPKR